MSTNSAELSVPLLARHDGQGLARGGDVVVQTEPRESVRLSTWNSPQSEGCPCCTTILSSKSCMIDQCNNFVPNSLLKLWIVVLYVICDHCRVGVEQCRSGWDGDGHWSHCLNDFTACVWFNSVLSQQLHAAGERFFVQPFVQIIYANLTLIQMETLYQQIHNLKPTEWS